MNKFVLMLLASMLVLPVTANAQIYKWKDKEGVMRYSDTPPPGNVEYESLSGKKFTPKAPTVSPEASKKAEEAASNKASAKPVEDPEVAKERKRIEEADAKARQQNCSAARANLKAFEMGGRISRVNEAGEREYLDDAALAQNAEQARKDIAQYCE